MTLVIKLKLFLGLIACLMCVSKITWAAEEQADITMKAVIATKGEGCDLILPENTLQFKPLSVGQLVGSVQTYQIKPLQLQLHCENESEAIRPLLTVEGQTPYAEDVEQTVFLSGTPNGVGFMLRQSSDDKPIALADFYKPSQAISNAKQGITLKVLNDDNKYYSENILWVGLVGPVTPVVNPGHYYASLVINVAFE